MTNKHKFKDMHHCQEEQKLLPITKSKNKSKEISNMLCGQSLAREQLRLDAGTYNTNFV